MKRSFRLAGYLTLALFVFLSVGARGDVLLAPIDISGAMTPIDVAVHASGTRAYVSNTGGTPSNSIAEIDTDTQAFLALQGLQSGVAGALRLAASPDGQWLYLITTSPNTVQVYQTNWPNPLLPPASPTFLKRITLSATPVDVAFSPAGDLAFVTTTSGLVDVINVATHTRQPSVSVGGSLQGVTAVDVPGRGLQVYVAVASSFTLKIAVIEGPPWTVRNIAVTVSPLFPAANAAGSKLYVSAKAGRVIVIDTATDTVSTVLLVGQDLSGIDVTVTPWGERVYVVDMKIVGSSWVVRRIDATTDTVMSWVSGISKNPMSVEALPDGTWVYVTSTKGSVNTSRLEVIETTP